MTKGLVGEEGVVTSKAGLGLRKGSMRESLRGQWGQPRVLGVFLTSDAGQGRGTWSPLHSAHVGIGGLKGKRPGEAPAPDPGSLLQGSKVKKTDKPAWGMEGSPLAPCPCLLRQLVLLSLRSQRSVLGRLACRAGTVSPS